MDLTRSQIQSVKSFFCNECGASGVRRKGAGWVLEYKEDHSMGHDPVAWWDRLYTGLDKLDAYSSEQSPVVYSDKELHKQHKSHYAGLELIGESFFTYAGIRIILEEFSKQKK